MRTQLQKDYRFFKETFKLLMDGHLSASGLIKRIENCPQIVSFNLKESVGDANLLSAAIKSVCNHLIGVGDGNLLDQIQCVNLLLPVSSLDCKVLWRWNNYDKDIICFLNWFSMNFDNPDLKHNHPVFSRMIDKVLAEPSRREALLLDQVVGESIESTKKARRL